MAAIPSKLTAMLPRGFLILSITAILLTFTSCREKARVSVNSTYPVKINIADALSYSKDIKLGDIADSIVYIALEATEGRTVEKIFSFYCLPEDIFIDAGPRTGFLRFDRSGKFINKVSSTGKGFGQYSPGSDFSVLDDPKRIYVLKKFLPRNIAVYDYGGYFFEKFDVTIPPYGSFEAMSPDRFLYFAGPVLQEDSLTMNNFLACLKDRDDNTIDILLHKFSNYSDFMNIQGYTSGGALSGKYFERAPLFFDGSSIDTVYSVRNDSIYPRYIIDNGGKILTSHLYIVPSLFVETPRDVFLIFLYNGYSYLLDYNKSSASVTSMKAPFNLSDETGKYPRRFENNLDGGISVIPGRTSRKGDIWYYLFNAAGFKRCLSEEKCSERAILHPEKQQALTSLASSMNDRDQLIIMAVYLKN
jgi:hypothetical protein